MQGGGGQYYSVPNIHTSISCRVHHHVPAKAFLLDLLDRTKPEPYYGQVQVTPITCETHVYTEYIVSCYTPYSNALNNTTQRLSRLLRLYY